MLQEKGNTIYHIVTLNELKTQTKDNYYKPGNFEKDGFIHCTAEKSTSLLVLEDYFAEISGSNVILILEIDITNLESEVKYESPSPVLGAGTSHLKDGILFPHIYGNLNIDAVAGVGKVERVENKFVWPPTFDDIKRYL
jgi:uncharacterized protein (DUF952 family)